MTLSRRRYIPPKVCRACRKNWCNDVFHELAVAIHDERPGSAAHYASSDSPGGTFNLWEPIRMPQRGWTQAAVAWKVFNRWAHRVHGIPIGKLLSDDVRVLAAGEETTDG